MCLREHRQRMRAGAVLLFFLTMLFGTSALADVRGAVDIHARTALPILPMAELAWSDPAVTQPSVLPTDLAFAPLDQSVINLGSREGLLWLRFKLTADQLRRHGDILEQRWANNVDVALFMQADEGASRSDKGYVAIPRMQVRGLLGAVRLPLDPSFQIPDFSGTRVFYLRLQADGPTVLNLHLMDKAHFDRHRLLRVMSAALLIGVLLGLSVYSLFLMMGVGEASYAWYTLFLLSIALYVGVQMGVFVPLLPDVVQSLAPIQQSLLMVVFVALTAMMFMRRFLGTREHDRASDWTLRLLMVLAVVALPITLMTNGQWAYRFGLLYGFGAMLAILVISLRAYLRGYRPALYVLVGKLFFTLAVVGYLLLLGGVLPYRWYLDMSIPMGAAVEAVLLSMGLALRIQEQQRKEAALRAEQGRLQRLSETDGLTGLLNRRTFDQRLAELIMKCERVGESFVLLLVDADHFKKLNDRFGHVKGDEVLLRLAKVMGENARRDDLVFRYGGEEFALLLPDTRGRDGYVIADRIRQRFALEQFELPGCSSSVSIGVAEWRSGEREADLVRRADRALYTAKDQGRNRVVVHEEVGAPIFG